LASSLLKTKETQRMPLLLSMTKSSLTARSMWSGPREVAGMNRVLEETETETEETGGIEETVE